MNKQTCIIACHYTSPCGNLILASYGNALCLADWQLSSKHEQNKARISKTLGLPFVEGKSELLDNTCIQLDEYFLGKRQTFDLPLLMLGTDFQREVWESLGAIPYGATCSYLDLAQSIHRPMSVRAVANAVGANPLSIIVPCHRIIGSNNQLRGYAGGIEAKALLLSLEGRP